jgi:hypothetical protein
MLIAYRRFKSLSGQQIAPVILDEHRTLWFLSRYQPRQHRRSAEMGGAREQ